MSELNHSINKANLLTKYHPASLREICWIALPLMVTGLSNNLMMFIDRIFLAEYSLGAMSAVVMAITICTTFQLPAIAIAAITEVFVGRYNGANQQAKIGNLVWQMIWFSAATALIYVPLAYFSAGFFFSASYAKEAIPYFKIILYFSPLLPMIAALSAFYIGRGKIKLVTVTAILGNFINVILAYVFIFGFSNWIPSMGAMGAALATGLSLTVQASILLVVFLQPKFQKLYQTAYFYLNPAAFWRCLKIGLPGGLGYIVEMSGWAILLQMMASIGETYLIVVAIGESIFLLMAFATDAIYKTIVVVASNLIGAKNHVFLLNAFKSACFLHACVALLFAIALFFNPESLIHFFTQANSANLSTDSVTYFAKITCIWVWVYFIFDGLVWIMAGLLTALKRTVFVMFMNTFAVWAFAILPVYLFVVNHSAEPSSVWKIMAFYTCLNALCFYWKVTGYAFNNKLGHISKTTKATA